jgi:hypothetical protein
LEGAIKTIKILGVRELINNINTNKVISQAGSRTNNQVRVILEGQEEHLPMPQYNKLAITLTKGVVIEVVSEEEAAEETEGQTEEAIKEVMVEVKLKAIRIIIPTIINHSNNNIPHHPIGSQINKI